MPALTRHVVLLAAASMAWSATLFAAAMASDANLATLPRAGASTPPRALVFRENEVQGKTVATDAVGLMQLLFGDGTTLTLGPGSELTIDSFVFDPSNATARITATLKHGVFRFIGGQTSKTPNGVTLLTPFGTIALKSSGADLCLRAECGPPHFDMIYGDAMTLSRGTTVIARVRKVGYSIVPDPDGTGAKIRITPTKWRDDMQGLLSWFVGKDSRELANSAATPRAEGQS